MRKGRGIANTPKPPNMPQVPFTPSLATQSLVGSSVSSSRLSGSLVNVTYVIKRGKEAANNDLRKVPAPTADADRCSYMLSKKVMKDMNAQITPPRGHIVNLEIK